MAARMVEIMLNIISLNRIFRLKKTVRVQSQRNPEKGPANDGPIGPRNFFVTQLS
jgi:hypothetical protein